MTWRRGSMTETDGIIAACNAVAAYAPRTEESTANKEELFFEAWWHLV